MFWLSCLQAKGRIARIKNMKNLKKKLPVIKKLFCKNGVVLAYLFGSRVKGTAGKFSDVDIAVLFDQKTFSQQSLKILLQLIGDLKRGLGEDNIDVIPLNNASPVLKHQAVILGRRIYSQDLKQALEFERGVFREHEDTAFLRRTYYRCMKDRIKNNKFGEFQL